MINYGRQFLDKKDIVSVSKVLSSDWLTQGPNVEKFENALKKKFGTNYCCVVANGTAALHLAGLSLGWKPGDIIITTPITFLATANCIVYTGATPNFVDINSATYTIDPNQLEDRIKFHREKNQVIKNLFFL